MERYDRQVKLSGWNQEALQRSSVIVVGVGALGCEVSKNLTLMGIGRIILIDNDCVELSNLSRQMLFTDSDIGRPKASAAARRLKEMNPNVEVECFDRDVRELPEELFSKGDVICSCLDSWGVRRWLNSLAVSLDKPLVDGAIGGLYGNVQVVLPKRTACLECHGENLISRDERVAECTLRRRKPQELLEDLSREGIDIDLTVAEELFKLNIKTIYDLKYTHLERMTEKIRPDLRDLILDIRERLRPRAPALQSVAATIAGIMTSEVLKILHGGSIGKPAKGLLVYDASSCRMSRVKLDRIEGCIMCGDDDEPHIIEVRSDATVYQLKELIARTFGFPDPEILYRAKRIDNDDVSVGELGIGEGDIFYVSTTRRHQPLMLKARLSVKQEAET